MPIQKFDIITLLHVLKYLQNPIEVLYSFSDSSVDGRKIVVEVQNADNSLYSLYKSELFTDFYILDLLFVLIYKQDTFRGGREKWFENIIFGANSALSACKSSLLAFK